MMDICAQTRERLAKFFLARLHRQAFLAALERAAEAGVVEAYEGESGIVAWMPGSMVSDLSMDHIGQRLGYVASLAPADQPRERWVRKMSGWQRVDQDDGFAAFDDQPAPRQRRAGAGKGLEQAAADPADPPCAQAAAAVLADGPLDMAPCPQDDLAAPVDRLALLRLVRGAARPPNAAEVAVVLMLADAAAWSGSDFARMQSVLRLPQPIVAVSGGVAGFEAVFVDLQRRGLVLPGITTTVDGYALRSTRDRPSGREDSLRTLILFRGKDHDDYLEHMDRQVGLAVGNVLPILAVADDVGRLPAALLHAADLDLSCGPLTQVLIAETIRIVTGEGIAPPQDRQGRGAVTACLGDDGASLEGHELLTLSDLALAVRPGVGARRCLDLLSGIIARRQAERNDQGKQGKLSKSGQTIDTVSCRPNATKTTGSTIIQPEPLDGVEEGRDAVLSVEALSGFGEARDWALALKEDLDLWRQGDLAWADMSTRLLLAGPPGTGKTTFARALCNTLQVPLVATSVATWLEPGYLGDVLKRMSAAFTEAEANGPAILFIDEVDTLGRRSATNRSHEDYWNSVVSRALELLDGVVRQSGIIVVGAANNPGVLDPALVRSGRLEKRIDIPMPDTDALAGILRHHLRDDIAGVVGTAPEQARGDASPIRPDGGKGSAVQAGRGATSVTGAGGSYRRCPSRVRGACSSAGLRLGRFLRNAWTGARDRIVRGAVRLSRLARHAIGYLAGRKQP